MTFSLSGPSVPVGAMRVLGPQLYPVIVGVAGGERALLEHIAEISGACAYIGLFGIDHPYGASAYTGMTTCGQDRPRLGSHLAYPDRADFIYVIGDATGSLTVDDAAVLERLFFAKIQKVSPWQMRCDRPRSGPVGNDRFSALMSFGGEAFCLLQRHFGLFADVYPARLRMVPRQFEEILFSYMDGPPIGQHMILESVGVTAYGVFLGDEGFVISASSEIREETVRSASGLNGARREELLYTGDLRRRADGVLEVRRDLWRPTATSAARFVTGGSNSGAAWRPIGPPRLRVV